MFFAGIEVLLFLPSSMGHAFFYCLANTAFDNGPGAVHKHISMDSCLLVEFHTNVLAWGALMHSHPVPLLSSLLICK